MARFAYDAAMTQGQAAALLSFAALVVAGCTGGTARLPALAHELGKRFGKEKLVQHRHFHSVIGGLADKAQALLEA